MYKDTQVVFYFLFAYFYFYIPFGKLLVSQFCWPPSSQTYQYVWQNNLTAHEV